MRNDFQVDTSSDWAFDRDALAVRIRGRFAVAAPDLEGSARLSVTGPGSARPQAATGRTGKTA